MATTIKWCFIYRHNKKQEKELPAYATHGALNDSTLRTRPHTPDTFNSQIKRKKEVATSLEVRWFALRSCGTGLLGTAGSLAARPRRRDPQRVRAHVALARPKGSRSSKALHHEDLSPQSSNSSHSPRISLQSNSSTRISLNRRTSFSLSARLFVNRGSAPSARLVFGSTPLLGVPQLSLSANRGGGHAFCLVNVTGRLFFTSARKSREMLS